MVASEQESAALKTGTGVTVGWLKRLVAGAEIDALEARVVQLARDAEAGARALAKSAAKLRELEASAAAAADEKASSRSHVESASAASRAEITKLQKQLDERDQQLSEIERTLANKEAERREAASKLAKAHTAAEEGRAGDAKAIEQKFARKLVELEGMLKAATRAREDERAARDASVSGLERHLADAANKQTEAQAAEARARASEHKAARKLAEVEQRAKESSAALVAARDAVTMLEMRVAELEGTLDGVTRDRQAERASCDERIADLELRLVEALAWPRDPTALEKVLIEREALLEELERAVVDQRSALEQRDARLAAQAAQLANGRANSTDPSS